MTSNATDEYDTTEESDAMEEANARLLAAAPELLDACTMLVNLLSRDCDADAFASELDHAQGVIAQAEGR